MFHFVLVLLVVNWDDESNGEENEFANLFMRSNWHFMVEWRLLIYREHSRNGQFTFLTLSISAFGKVFVLLLRPVLSNVLSVSSLNCRLFSEWSNWLHFFLIHRAGNLVDHNMASELGGEVTSSGGPVRLEDLQRILSSIQTLGIVE